jgi:hypothetical protein
MDHRRSKISSMNRNLCLPNFDTWGHTLAMGGTGESGPYKGPFLRAPAHKNKSRGSWYAINRTRHLGREES